MLEDENTREFKLEDKSNIKLNTLGEGLKKHQLKQSLEDALVKTHLENAQVLKQNLENAQLKSCIPKFVK